MVPAPALQSLCPLALHNAIGRLAIRGAICFAVLGVSAPLVAAQTPTSPALLDSDLDGLPDEQDSCPKVDYQAGYKWSGCLPMDLNPGNDGDAECKARERVAAMLLNGGRFTTRIAFAVVENDEVHFADAFEYLGGGQFKRDPRGIHRLFRVGSTSKAFTAVAAKVLEEQGQLSLNDFVSDEDGTQVLSNGQRTLRQLLAHEGAFKTDYGAIHIWCYPGDMASFWAETDDLVSPHYDSANWGNLGGGYQYSAFNYSLAGSYLTHKVGANFASILQSRVFDQAQMCTATFDSKRAVSAKIAGIPGVSETGVMHVGPAVNTYAPGDPLCVDNYYSSDAVLGDPYTWLYYRFDETDAEPRDPAGGAIASVIDVAHFARSLLASYHGTPGGILSQAGVRDLWGARNDLGAGAPYERYYGTGFFTDSQPGGRIHQVGHGGSRAGYASAMVIRPEENRAVVILANSDLSTVALSDLAKTILDDFR